MLGILDGKVAVITGGSRGLGLGIAQEYASAGASVVIASRSQRSVDKAVALIRSLGGAASGMAVDVADIEQMKALCYFAINQHGHLDIWVNNAGTAGPYGPTIGFDPAEFTQVVNTNIMGVYHGSLVAMRHFTKQNSGKLINVLGHGYNGPVAWQNAYSASKVWVNSFTKALAIESKESKVGVFAFNPGMVLTELLTNVDVIEGSEDRLKVFPTIVRMWAKPPNIPAKKALWIASSATDGKTGLLVNIFSPWTMLTGAIAEGYRRLFHKPDSDIDFQIKPIPHYKG